MPTIRINNLDYFYRRRGTGAVLVLLHGFTGSSANWSEVIDRFTPLMDTIAIDLLGHGRTAAPTPSSRYAMDLAAKDIVALLGRLGCRNVNILGYSMGGRLALYLAHRYPELIKSLVLESASPGIAGNEERAERRRNDALLAQRIKQEGLLNFVRRWEKLPLFSSQLTLDDNRKALLRQQRLSNNPLGLANSLRGMGTGSQPSLWRKLGEIRTPALILCGELDRKFVSIGSKMAALMPEAELCEVSGAGHNVHLEKPSTFVSEVLSFLNSGP